MKVQYSKSDQDYIYLSMPYCEKGSLNTLINNRFLTVKEIIQYALDFLTGLHYIHTKNLVHFDIKPTNIILTNSNRAIITDFGLSKYLNDYGFAEQNPVYLKHVAPERLKGTKVTNLSDIYQAGVTLYRLCNGNECFDNQVNRYKSDIAEAIKTEQFPDRKYYLPHIPPKLRKIINKSLSTEPTERYQTVLEMINDIAKIEIKSNWVYNVYKDSMTWERESSSTHEEQIKLCDTAKGWDITGEKIRKSDGNIRNMRKVCSNGHNSLRKALSQVEKVLRELE